MDDSPRPEDHQFMLAEVLKSVVSRLIEGNELAPIIFVFAFAWAGDQRIVTGAYFEPDPADPDMVEELLDPESALHARILDAIGVGPEMAVHCERGNFYCGDPALLENWNDPEPPPWRDAIAVVSRCKQAQCIAFAPIYADERTLGPAQVYLTLSKGLEPLGVLNVDRSAFVLNPMTVIPQIFFSNRH